MIEKYVSKVDRGPSLSYHFSLTMRDLHWQGKDLFKAIGEEQKINVHVNIHKQIQSHIYLSYF